MRGILFSLILLLISSQVNARPVIADISEYDIHINSAFTGTSLLLFGARNEPGDIVVVVRGPKKKFTLRKKERVLGMWMNTQQVVYPEAPDFYSIATSKKLDLIRDKSLFPALQIGIEHVAIDSAYELPDASSQVFRKAFVDYQERKKLYNPVVESTTFMGETLFKTRVEFPDNIPRGTYTAEVYLLLDGALAGMQSIPITVTKTGFDALVYDMAHGSSATYGLLAIIMALSIGWLASQLFRKV